MYKIGDKVIVAQSNGLTFRNGPNILGDVMRTIPNTTELTVLNVIDGQLTWVNVTYEGVDGWLVAKNTSGDVNVRVVPKPQKRRYKKKTKRANTSPE